MKMKKTKRFLVVFLAMVMLFSMQLNVFAASATTTRTTTKTATAKMSIVLSPNQTGDSTAVTITFSGLPSNAVVTELTVNSGTMTYNGAVLSNYITISGNGRTEQLAWGGQANRDLPTNNFLGVSANGTYTLTFNATNMSNLNIGTKTYKPSITIKYTY